MMKRATVVALSVAAMVFPVVGPAPIANAFAGQTTRVSVSSAGVPANATVFSGVLSADGRYVVFWTSATNLLESGPVSGAHVYRHDRLSGATALISVSTSGAPGNNVSRDPSVSADGRFVVFSSFATDLVPGGTNGLSQVFVRDMQTNTTRLASADASGAQGDLGGALSGLPGAHEISDDGRYVTFTSTATNLVGAANGAQQVYVKDMTTGAVVRASVNDAGDPGNANSFTAAISGNSLFVAFRSDATNLSPSSNTSQIFVRDLAAGLTTLESPGAAAVGRPSTVPTISSDGRYVAFVSDARLDPLDLDTGTPDVYLRDRVADTTVVASLSPNTVAGAASGGPSISGDGRWVAFNSIDDKMVTPDTNGIVADIFLYDRDTRLVTIVSRNDAGDQGSSPTNGASSGASLSFDGGLVLFASTATNLVPSSSCCTQLYVRVLSANQAPVVNAGPDETVAEGTSLSRSGSFTDLDASTAWTATVDYGAGPVALLLAPDKTFSLAHEPFPVGTYVITVAVTDNPPAGLTGTDTFTFTVTNVAPSVDLGAEAFLYFDATLHRSVCVADPGTTVHPTETYSASLNYGDGTPTVQAQMTGTYGNCFWLDHTYATPATYVVNVTVSDGNGGVGGASLTVHVFKYAFTWLDPVGDMFVVGRNLPVKFTVQAADGSFVFDQSVRVDVIDEAGNVLAGPYLYGEQPSRAVTVSGDAYHVNVDTKDFAPGIYWLRVRFDSATLVGEVRLGTTGTPTTLGPRGR